MVHWWVVDWVCECVLPKKKERKTGVSFFPDTKNKKCVMGWA
jgi:hypothetical protein